VIKGNNTEIHICVGERHNEMQGKLLKNPG
jgi:hypothetical protein